MEVAKKSIAQMVHRTWLIRSPDKPCPSSASSRNVGSIKILPEDFVLQLVGAPDEVVGQVARNFVGLVLVKEMLRHQLREICAVHASGHIVPRRNGKESPRVVIKSHCVVETSRLRRCLAEAPHSLRAVVKPPRRAESQTGI